MEDYQSRRRYIGPVGEKPNVKAVQGMMQSYSITLITSLADVSPYFVKYRESSNTAEDFMEFLLSAASTGFIRKGDVLILDNATVHQGLFFYFMFFCSSSFPLSHTPLPTLSSFFLLSHFST